MHWILTSRTAIYHVYTHDENKPASTMAHLRKCKTKKLKACTHLKSALPVILYRGSQFFSKINQFAISDTRQFTVIEYIVSDLYFLFNTRNLVLVWFLFKTDVEHSQIIHGNAIFHEKIFISTRITVTHTPRKKNKRHNIHTRIPHSDTWALLRLHGVQKNISSHMSSFSAAAAERRWISARDL